MESGVEFTAVDFPQANRLTVHILASVAEHEATMISTRTKQALAAAKARGIKLGGDRAGIIASQCRKGARASAAVRSAEAQRRAEDLAPVISAIRTDSASLRQIAAVLNEREIPAPRGGRWSAVQVLRVLARDPRATPMPCVPARGMARQPAQRPIEGKAPGSPVA
jgi:DNA invertase Pin-like site-specific DNA recombinase